MCGVVLRMVESYSGDNLLDALLMTLHLEEGLDLADGQVLPVTQGDQLIESAQKLERIVDNFPLIQALACAGNDLGEEVQGVDVLEDVGLAVGDENHVKLVKRLIYESHIVLLDGRVLGAAVSELGERSQECLYSRSWHLPKLSREDSFPSPGANRSCEDDLKQRLARGDIADDNRDYAHHLDKLLKVLFWWLQV